MTAKQKLEANEYKSYRVLKAGGCCEVCGIPSNNLQLAHRLPKTKYNLKYYGKEIIHHDLNIVVTCDKCNSSVLIGRGSNPVEAQKLIDSIKRDLKLLH